METFAVYLFKSVIWLSGFAIVYLLFLRNERFFRLKRYYLIVGIFISLFFPLLSAHYQVELPAPGVSSVDLIPGGNAVLSAPQLVSPEVSPEKPFDYKDILLLLYLSGVLFFVSRLILHIRSLFITIKKANINNHGSAKMIRSSEFYSSFSFLNYVFINPSVSATEMEQIMNHELVHIRQKHWFDLFLIELVRIMQWINPFVWIYTSFIRLNHEYIADEMALQSTSDPAIYKATLLNQMFNSPVISLSNSFNYSLDKKRFDMMKKIIISPYRKLKVFVILPVIAAVFYAFATPKYNYVAPVSDSLAIYQASSIIQQGQAKPPKPLIIIDGVESELELADIDMHTIRTVTVLKDKSHTSIYGEKGKNGVVLVTLKKEVSLTNTVPAISQNVVIGTVLKEDGTPFPGVPIMVTGSKIRESTDASGHFSIGDVPKDAFIVFSHVGYKTQVLKAVYNSDMTVKMEIEPEYKGSATGSGSNTSATQRPVPIVVIDGVISEKSFIDARKDLGYDMGIVNMIRGKEATDKYGEKGVNGVYDITTRKKAFAMGLKPPFPRLAPEDFPTFQGESRLSFSDWVASQVKYPPEARANKLEGWVSVNFTIELNGNLSNVVSTIPVDKVLSDEVIRAVQSSPKWDPPKNPDVDEPFTSGITLKFKLPDQILDEAPFVVVEQMPQYPGGDGELLRFIAENTQYPAEARGNNIQGRVIVRFVVNTEGKAEGISVLKGVHPLLDAEAVKVVSLLSGFEPGMQGGKPVNVWYMVPITFSLPTEKTPE